jgi:hypothetical protein
MSLGLGLSSKFTLQLATQDGALRVLAHDGVNASMPATIGFTRTGSLYGAPAFNQQSRNALLTFQNLKRLVGLVSNPLLNDTLLQKDTRTFKDSIVITPGEGLELKNNVFAELFTSHDDIRALGLKSTLSLETVLALLLATIHNTWAAQLPSVKPLALLGYDCNKVLMHLEPLKGVVISVPPWFSTSQRLNLYYAFQLASIPIVDIVHDYFALLHTYALQRMVDVPRFVVFFDFGHTETTISLSHLDPTTLIAQCLDYESHIGLGVRDCVDLVLKKVRAKFMTAKGFGTKEEMETIFSTQNQKYLILWWNSVHKALEKLTTAPSVTIECQQPFGDGDEFEFKYTRDEFEKDLQLLFTQHLFKILTRFFDRILPPLFSQYGQKALMDMLSIECAGAGCRIPMFQRLLGEFQWVNNKTTTPVSSPSSSPSPMSPSSPMSPVPSSPFEIPQTISNFTIASTLNPDEAATRGCAFITASRRVLKEADEDGNGTVLYNYTNHPQKWTFTDQTLLPNHKFQFLEMLSTKMDMLPTMVNQRYHDEHQYKILWQRDREMAAFLCQCNKLESLCYEHESDESESTQAMIEKTHEWLGGNRAGDYRQVDLMIDLFNAVVIDKIPFSEAQTTYNQELTTLMEYLSSEAKLSASLNQNLKEAHEFKVESAKEMWVQIGGQENPMVKKWMGDDFYMQISSPQLARPGSGGNGIATTTPMSATTGKSISATITTNNHTNNATKPAGTGAVTITTTGLGTTPGGLSAGKWGRGGW